MEALDTNRWLEVLLAHQNEVMAALILLVAIWLVAGTVTRRSRARAMIPPGQLRVSGAQNRRGGVRPTRLHPGVDPNLAGKHSEDYVDVEDEGFDEDTQTVHIFERERTDEIDAQRNPSFQLNNTNYETHPFATLNLPLNEVPSHLKSYVRTGEGEAMVLCTAYRQSFGGSGMVVLTTHKLVVIYRHSKFLGLPFGSTTLSRSVDIPDIRQCGRLRRRRASRLFLTKHDRFGIVFPPNHLMVLPLEKKPIVRITYAVNKLKQAHILLSGANRLAAR